MSQKGMSTSSKFMLLTCLYFSQGLPYGFFTQVLPVVMREDNASLPEISLTSLLALPWMLKFMWAPLVDTYGHEGIGRRKSWILSLQTCAIVLFATLGLFANGHGLMPLVIGYLIANMISATQDIATDGLAVNLLEPRERGVGNGIQVAAYRLGMIFGGGAILVVLAHFPRRVAFWSISLVLVLATIPLLKAREPKSRVTRHQRPMWTLIFGYLKRPGVWIWLIMIGFYKFGDAMTTQMLRPFLVDLGWSKTAIGSFNSLGSAGGLIGALAGGFLVPLWGRYRAVVIFGMIQTGGVLAYYLICSEILPSGWLYTIGFMEHFTGGMATAALFTAMMDTCEEETSATDYTIQASVVVMTTGVAKALSGFTARDLGYEGNFILSGILCLVGAILFAMVYRQQRGHKEAFRLS